MAQQIHLLTDNRILERTTRTYSIPLRDGEGDDAEPVALSAITALTLTHYVGTTKAIINGRNAQNALNANDVTVTDGLLTWRMQVADNTILRDRGPGTTEVHVALFSLTYTTDAGTETARYEEEFSVYNLHGVS